MQYCYWLIHFSQSMPTTFGKGVKLALKLWPNYISYSMVIAGYVSVCLQLYCILVFTVFILYILYFSILLQASWRPQRQHKYSNTRTLTISTPPAGAHGWHPDIGKKLAQQSTSFWRVYYNTWRWPCEAETCRRIIKIKKWMLHWWTNEQILKVHCLSLTTCFSLHGHSIIFPVL
jgi:hypothetical protein